MPHEFLVVETVSFPTDAICRIAQMALYVQFTTYACGRGFT